jgi:hypothetical protein
MRMLAVTISVTCDKERVLERLRSNLDRHVRILDEAREGYVLHARKLLERRLQELGEGRAVPLVFDLQPPKDFSDVYRTLIEMIELHEGPRITLTANDVHRLLQDRWDWTPEFLASTAPYSLLASGHVAA